MGLVVGTLLGLGLFCCWWACWPTAPERTATGRIARWRADLDDALVQSGARGLTPRTLLACCVATGLLTALLAVAVSGSPTIAACFAAMSCGAPLVWSADAPAAGAPR